MNLYGFVTNEPIIYIDILGRDPALFSTQAGNSNSEGDPLIKRRQARDNLLNDLKRKASPNKPDCGKTDDCTLFSVIIELPEWDYGNPITDKNTKKVGHTGMAVGEEYWDFGPIDGTNNVTGSQWWGKYGGEAGLPEKYRGTFPYPGLKEILAAIKNRDLAQDQDVLLFQWCACEAHALKVRYLWGKLYDDINNLKFCIPGRNCTSTVGNILNGLDVTNSVYSMVGGGISPERYASQILSDFKSECGSSKGQVPYLEKMSVSKRP